MAFDPTLPQTNALISSAELRSQFPSLTTTSRPTKQNLPPIVHSRLRNGWPPPCMGLTNLLLWTGAVVLLFGLVACQRKNQAGSTGHERDREQATVRWQRESVLGIYEARGGKNRKWDKDVKEAISRWSELSQATTNEPALRRDLATHLQNAVRAGCDDPLVKYLHCHYVVSEQDHSWAVLSQAYLKASHELERSLYSHLWRFRASLQAARVLLQGPRREVWAKVWEERAVARSELLGMLEGEKVPQPLVCRAMHEALEDFQISEGNLRLLFRGFEEASADWPPSVELHLIRAEYYTGWAWCGRGFDTSDRVKAAQWKLFAERLKLAEQELAEAWSLDSNDTRIASAMLVVELGQHQGQARMEQWFQRAMALDPANYLACTRKLTYLEPKWGGSPEAMIGFGRQCVESREWKGGVPLILAGAHLELASSLPPEQKTNYLRQAEVWADVRRSFERFFELNPNDNPRRNFYAKTAYDCGQWQVFLQQVALLERTNFLSFGGGDVFSDMLETAKKNAGSSP